MSTLSRSLTLAAATLLCASCGPANGQNMLRPGGPAARTLADANGFILILFAAVTVVMWILIGWIALRRRGTLTEHAPWNAGGDLRWVFIGGMLVPILILGGVFVLGLRTMAAFPMGDQMHGPAPQVRVIGHQWWWEVQYLYGDVSERILGANEIHIPVGQQVDIDLESHDVIHSFWVPEIHGKVDLIPGMVNRIRIQADRPAVFRGECAEFCGPQHAHMILAVRADAPADFEKWLRHARQPAATPPDPLAQEGMRVFMNGPCALCHTIRGTDAHGLVGPDLTHVGSRLGIAAETLPNNLASVEAWVTHAQSLKPYSQMPSLSMFTGEEARALAAYLRALQ
jgi:cytochrome c oxidase subunit 2